MGLGAGSASRPLVVSGEPSSRVTSGRRSWTMWPIDIGLHLEPRLLPHARQGLRAGAIEAPAEGQWQHRQAAARGHARAPAAPSGSGRPCPPRARGRHPGAGDRCRPATSGRPRSAPRDPGRRAPAAGTRRGGERRPSAGSVASRCGSRPRTGRRGSDRPPERCRRARRASTPAPLPGCAPGARCRSRAAAPPRPSRCAPAWCPRPRTTRRAWAWAVPRGAGSPRSRATCRRRSRPGR